MEEKRVSKEIKNQLPTYLQMDLGRITTHCPYWMNKIREGKVVVRGKGDGKGKSEDIKNFLKQSIAKLPLSTNITQENVFKLAKRERIGIDCSGLVYRILDEVLKNHGLELDQIFPGGVTKTNARRLTNSEVTYRISKASDIKPGDLIRMMAGKHVLLVVENDGKYIHYIHSSNRRTREKGVHTSKIKIISPYTNLDSQMWLEETPEAENFGKKNFHIKKGDGARRLKVIVYDN